VIFFTLETSPYGIEETSNISTNHLKWIGSKVFDNKYTSRPYVTLTYIS